MMYGQDGYYPGESDYESDGVKGTDDFHTYSTQSDEHALKASMRAYKAKKIRSFGEHTPVSRNDHFATGAVADPPAPQPRSAWESGSASARAVYEKEAWDRAAGKAANLAADIAIHERAKGKKD